MNHPFVDGNKRIGRAALETFSFLHGFELSAPVEDAERTFLDLAAGKVSRDDLTNCITRDHQPL